MSKIRKNAEEYTNNPHSLENAIMKDSELMSFLRIKNKEDLDKIVARMKEIAGRSYALKPFPEQFESFLPKKRHQAAERLALMYHAVYHKVDFAKVYRSLSVNERDMVSKQILSLYHFGEKKAQKREKIPEKLREFYWKKIETIMSENGASIDYKMHAPVSKDSKKVIRWDAYGLLERPQASNLSEEYHQFKKEEHTPNGKPSKYDLFTSPTWAYNFAQFKNFAGLEDKVKEALANSDIPCSMLSRLNAYDFADIIYNAYGNPEYKSTKLFTGSKSVFIKEVGKLYKDQIMQIHKKMGIDERYTRSLIREMTHFGVSSNVTPLEFVATQDAIDHFQSVGIDCSGLKAGKEYPDEFYDVLFSKDEYHYIVAHDKFGNRVTGPEYDVDHKDTVDDCGGLLIDGFRHPNINAVNRWPRYRLVERNTHYMFIHAKDSVRQFGEKEESYVSRVRLPDENVVIMFGVDKSMWLSHDMSHYPYVIEQDKYFSQTYVPQIRAAENIGKVAYVEPKVFGQESKEFTKKKGKKNEEYGNSRILNEAIATKRRKGKGKW